MMPEEQYQDQQGSEPSDSFSSMDSNQDEAIQDELGFQLHQRHREKDIGFPPVPPHLPKLYQIYLHNTGRKKELQNALEEFIQKQIKTLRLKYDQETSAIEEYIDIEEESKEYQYSKKKYQERKKQLEKLNRQYRELKIMHVEGMMKTDPKLMNLASKFIEENREVVAHCVWGNSVSMLCREKVWVRRSHAKINIQKKLIQKNSVEEEQRKQRLQNPSRDSKNTSSEDQFDRPLYRFTIRTFKFYKKQDKSQAETQEEPVTRISFYPMDRYLEIPQNYYKDQPLCGLAFQPSINAYIVHSQNSFFIFPAEHRKHSEASNTPILRTDTKIIFCSVAPKSTLYIGTNDSVVRAYEILPNNTLVLNKIIGCSYQQFTPVTHFCTTPNPQVLLFVENGNKLCEVNLTTYTSYLLSQLPEQIVSLDGRFITTQNLLYTDYYIASGTRGKVSLQHNSRLRKILAAEKGQLIKIQKHQGLEYLIVDLGNGNFEVKILSNMNKEQDTLKKPQKN